MTPALEAWLVMAAAIAATYLWRALGVAFASRISAGSPLFRWISAVTYAMLAGLVARLLLAPSGALAGTDLAGRLAATAFAFIVFFLCRRNLPLGLVAGVGSFAAWQAVLN